MAAATAVMAGQSLDSRVARLESDVAHIRSDVADMKLDIRELRVAVGGMREEVHEVATSLSAAIARLDLKLTRGLAANRICMLLQSAAILGVMARGFGWL